MSPHLVCPDCGSSQIARSRTKGLFELTLRLFQIKPYRCLACDYRHFRFRPTHDHNHHALPTASK